MRSFIFKSLLPALFLAVTPSVINAQNAFPSSGNVGIGTVLPGSSLEIGGGTWEIPPAGTQGGALSLQRSDNALGLFFGVNSAGVSWIQSQRTDFVYYYPLSIQPNGGNVGIGNTAPLYKLDVSGTENIANGFGNPNSESAYRLKFFDNGGTYNDVGIGLDGSGNGDEKMWFNALQGFYFNYGTGGQRITFDASGNVGIGTTNPGTTLDVEGTAGLYGIAVFSQNGRTGYIQLSNGTGGINSFQPRIVGVEQGDDFALEMVGQAASDSSGDLPVVSIDARNANSPMVSRPLLGVGSYVTGIDDYRFIITSDGNVGIGTTNPTYPLSVNGTVEAKEVIVQTGWSDYVFSPTYRLEPLSKVEQQIRQKGHLPGMPSAQQSRRSRDQSRRHAGKAPGEDRGADASPDRAGEAH